MERAFNQCIKWKGKIKMLRTEGGHFWITFKNGYTISVFNGFGSHTENNFAFDKWRKIYEEKDPYEKHWESELVEIAIIYKPSGELVTKNILKSDDNVMTIGIDELVDMINLVRNLEG